MGKAGTGRKKGPVLTADQERALAILESGVNVFLTGEAGTGKSYLLDTFLKRARRSGKSVLAMAPTGIAATNLEKATTIHRGLDISVHPHSPTEPLKGIPDVLRRADVVIVDEISMCRIDLFDVVARMFMAADTRPDGSPAGKQIVLVGDFMQLPPVVVGREERSILASWYPDNPSFYCFCSPNWDRLGLRDVVLHEIVRQSDAEFVRNLNLARAGDPACIPYFNTLCLDSFADADPDAIWLYPTNKKADSLNEARIGLLGGREHVFDASESGEMRGGDKMAPKRLRLKEGARVMSLVNAGDLSYINGSLGTVTGFGSDGKTVRVRFDNGAEAEIAPYTWEIYRPTISIDRADSGRAGIIEMATVGTYRQIPLKAAYAVTIHKSQGQTFPKAVVDPCVFSEGQLYVALSRCTDAEHLRIYPRIEPRHLKSPEMAARFHESIDGGCAVVGDIVTGEETLSTRTVPEGGGDGGDADPAADPQDADGSAGDGDALVPDAAGLNKPEVVLGSTGQAGSGMGIDVSLREDGSLVIVVPSDKLDLFSRIGDLVSHGNRVDFVSESASGTGSVLCDGDR